MGKSPGKWIKAVILGKKHSKSNVSKGAEVENDAVLHLPDDDLHLNHSFVEEALNLSNEKVGTEAESENGIPGNVSCEPVNELTDSPGVAGLSSTDGETESRVEEATIIVQASCRGFLARREFWALKGIIRLQALIRGHLVRKQAVATLHCLYCIVRLQAVARGRRARISYPGLELSRKTKVQGSAFLASVGMPTVFRSQKLSTNAFAIKLLSLLPKAMALSLQYGPEEPNSAWMWLKRWSLLASPTPISDVESQAKLVSASPIVAKRNGKSRRTFRKFSSAVAGGETGSLDKAKRNPRTIVANHQTSSPHEEQKPEKGNGCNLKKENSEPAEPGITNLAEQERESNDVVDQSSQTEKISISDSRNVDDPIVPTLQRPDDLVCNEQNSLENGTENKNKPSIPKEDHIKKENQKTKRRKSVTGKKEYSRENVSQNTASVPSYMAATESAKAKLRRMQGPAKLSEESGVVKNGVAKRRHSLPISANSSKPTTLSPRLQKPTQTNANEEKVLQHGWRR